MDEATRDDILQYLEFGALAICCRADLDRQNSRLTIVIST
jgi:hypothetical protein